MVEMEIINLSQDNSVIGDIIAELRSETVQRDRQKFRRNVERVGELMAYEVSKRMNYSAKTVRTPLADATVNTIDDAIVIGTIFRAGLPFQQGFLNIFDKADCAFLSAARYYKDDESKQVAVKLDYLASPDLSDKTFILVDPMLATGGSLLAGYDAFCTKGTPARLHVCSLIASRHGVDVITQRFAKQTNVTLWCAVIDDKLNEASYIVPGLGDAGDLSYGEKI